MDIGCPNEGGQGSRDSLHNRLLGALFLTLDLFPLAKNRLSVSSFLVAKDMRVTSDEFFADVVGGICKSKSPPFLGQICMEDNLEKEVAKFFAKI